MDEPEEFGALAGVAVGLYLFFILLKILIITALIVIPSLVAYWVGKWACRQYREEIVAVLTYPYHRALDWWNYPPRKAGRIERKIDEDYRLLLMQMEDTTESWRRMVDGDG